MFTIELTLKHTPVPLSVQKKEQEAADGLYTSIVGELRSGSDKLLELTCDQQPGKKISVLASEIASVQIFEKTSTATASGRPPGFFALSADQ
ncbi:MAG TPA: hypothetical protein IGR64_14505 [Leptolyngbyaceae cyanobacterium M65_K2018_010]|nr:hypothetical protein [Leptolyngbyaceae cyanobacterium M65_K2018_010]